MYWATTTAPPAAKAEKRKRNKKLIESTNETLATALSPTDATMIVSARPKDASKILSMIRGIRRAAKRLLEKSRGCKSDLDKRANGEFLLLRTCNTSDQLNCALF